MRLHFYEIYLSCKNRPKFSIPAYLVHFTWFTIRVKIGPNFRFPPIWTIPDRRFTRIFPRGPLIQGNQNNLLGDNIYISRILEVTINPHKEESRMVGKLAIVFTLAGVVLGLLMYNLLIGGWHYDNWRVQSGYWTIWNQHAGHDTGRQVRCYCWSCARPPSANWTSIYSNWLNSHTARA